MSPSELPAKYANVPLEERLRAIAEAARECPYEKWGDDQESGVLLYASHLLECEWWQRIQTSGAASAIAQGQSASQPTLANLDSTTYGQRFQRLRSNLVTTTGFLI